MNIFSKSFDRSRTGSTFLITCCALFLFILAGYDTYQWNVTAKTWSQQTAEFRELLRSRGRGFSNFLIQKGLVRYSIQGSMYESWVNLSQADAIAIKGISTPGQTYPSITIRIDPKNPLLAISDPTTSTYEHLGFGLAILLIA